MERLRDDVAALAAMTRGSAGPGERLSAEWIAGRLREAGVEDVRIEPYRGQGTYAWAYVLYTLVALVAGRLPRRIGIPLALVALAALEGDASGRAPWGRRLLPASEGANVVARLPAAGETQRTLVLVAHHDAARTGLYWRMPRKASAPALPPGAAAFLVDRTRLGRVALWADLLLTVDIATSPTVPGANDNATGVAATLALAERWRADPLPGVEVLVVNPGSEESGLAGMRAFLADHPLDPATTLVLCLDTLGCGEPIVLDGEWSAVLNRYRGEDLDLADAGAARAGLAAPRRYVLGTWTDAVLARHAGVPAISMLSVSPQDTLTEHHRMTDTADRVDFASVERCLALAAGIGEAFAAPVRLPLA